MTNNSEIITARINLPREPWFLRSRARLYSVLLLALAIPAIALSAFVAIDVKSELRTQSEKENELVAAMVARSAREQFNGLELYVSSYADRIKFSEAVRDRDTLFVLRVMRQMLEGNPLVSRVFCADTTGVLWIDTPADPSVHGVNFSHRDWFRGVSGGDKVYTSEIYRRSALGQPYTIAVAGRVSDPAGRYCGILAAQVTIADLASWFLDMRLPKQGTVTLVDQRGHWIDNRGNGIEPDRLPDTTAFAQVLMGMSSHGEAHDPRTGSASLIDIVPVAATGWTVVAIRPLNAVYSPIRALQRTILFYFAIGLIGMIVIGSSMYRTLGGYHEERNKAQERLQRAYGDVEDRVRQRTADLVSANAELGRLVAIIESSSEGIGSSGFDGFITSWNPAAEKIYGYLRDEIVGQSSKILLPEDRANETAGILQRIAAGESVPPFETVRRRKDGRLIHVSLAYSPVRDDRGRISGVSVVSRDITREKVAEEQAKRLETERAELLDRLQMTLDRMPIGCVLNDTDFRFTYWNPAAERIFGYTLEEVRGKHPFGVITPESSQAQVAKVFRQLAEGGRDVDAVGENVTKDGRRITCIWNNTSLRDVDGRFLGIISMCQDVTERNKAEERMRIYATALAQSNRELQDFAFVASHDLQEPLRKIAAFGERLKESADGAMDDESREYLARMLKAAGRMQTLIHDLLDFSRVATRAQPFAPTDLRSVAAEVMSDLEARIEQTGGRVKIGELPTIDADQIQMRQLLQNLIANALKFHQRDVAPVVTVTVRVLPAGETGGSDSCQLIVEDNGIGFEQKYADRIFTPFQRLHGRNEFEGTGMGLAICRKIAERHHGSITAISTPGVGSSFIVTLPTKQPDAGSTLWTQPGSPSASSWPMTIPTTAS